MTALLFAWALVRATRGSSSSSTPVHESVAPSAPAAADRPVFELDLKPAPLDLPNGSELFAVQADGHRVKTVEGLANPDGSLSVLQDSFCEAHGLQCGYCTPGMLVAAQALLDAVPRPTEEQIREAIGGNLCRCTGYQQIVEAVQLAAERLAQT